LSLKLTIIAGCPAGYDSNVYYTDKMVRDVLLNGIVDVDIRPKSLGADDMQKKPINKVITFIESKKNHWCLSCNAKRTFY